ncbi:hypothetical protein F5Y14DRAFT_405961 [Nemania sp. NC0429]|nr:hypothetical protein F5Y14DRAFT_405961 [Nemania sp. NC0429]
MAYYTDKFKRSCTLEGYFKSLEFPYPKFACTENFRKLYGDIKLKRSFISSIPLCQLSSPQATEASLHDRFAISGQWQYLNDSHYVHPGLNYWSDCLSFPHCDDTIQKLGYSAAASGPDVSGLPEFVFQLGSIILPGNNLVETEVLPFMVVIDILDAEKGVWLVYSSDILEDRYKKRPSQPSLDSLNEFRFLFGDLKYSRQPRYNIARIAESIEEWKLASWEAIVSNLTATRNAIAVRIGLASKAELQDAIDNRWCRQKEMDNLARRWDSLDLADSMELDQ